MTAPASLATVSPSDLARALGCTRGELYRARTRGEIPEPDRVTLGGHARWNLDTAREIVRKHKRPVPAEWA